MDPQAPGTRTDQPAGGPAYQPPAPVQQFAIGNKPGQPDLVKRFGAYLIDAIALAVLAYLPIPVVGLLGAVAATAGWLLRDTLVEHRSLGKKVLGLQAVNGTGQPVSVEQSIKRNAPFALIGVAAILTHLTLIGAILSIPVSLAACAAALVEGIMVATGQPRFGDRFAGTHVVDTQTQPAIQS